MTTGTINAIFCGGNLCWDSDSDAISGNNGEDINVSFYHCMTCGRSYEIYEPDSEEKKDYSNYWNPKNN